MSSETLENLLREERRFPPVPEFAAQAVARPSCTTKRPRTGCRSGTSGARAGLGHALDQTLDWCDAPFAQWFVGGTLNVAYNCVDRHVEAGHGDRVAIHFEGEPGDTRTITYAELQREVCQAANALLALGVGPGDRVAIYLPMIPEAAIAMLACARIGAPHSVVFGGFSAEALRSRIEDAEAKVVITADGGYRRGAPAALKPAVDEAVAAVARRAEGARRAAHRPGRRLDRRPRRVVARRRRPPARTSTTPRAFDAEHPLFILYTSGTTGKPKGILHTTGGYLTQVAYTHRNVFDLQARRPTSTGAPPTSAGSPGTATSSTARWPTAPPR